MAEKDFYGSLFNWTILLLFTSSGSIGKRCQISRVRAPPTRLQQQIATSSYHAEHLATKEIDRIQTLRIWQAVVKRTILQHPRQSGVKINNCSADHLSHHMRGRIDTGIHTLMGFCQPRHCMFGPGILKRECMNKSVLEINTLKLYIYR